MQYAIGVVLIVILSLGRIGGWRTTEDKRFAGLFRVADIQGTQVEDGSIHHRSSLTSRHRAEAMPADDPHRALIERYLTAYNAFDVPGMLALLRPDVTFENVSGSQVTAAANGREEFRALAEHAATLFTSRRQTIRQYIPTADGAQVEIDYEGVLAADLGPELRAGATLRLAGRSTFAIQDGRIARIVDES
jgi:ketosteroid isomerase-like protein